MTYFQHWTGEIGFRPEVLAETTEVLVINIYNECREMKMMILKYAVAVLALCFVALSFAEEPVPLSKKMASCGKCHMGKMALTGKPVEEILAGLVRIREGKRPHPPGLQAFEAEQLPEVAAILSGVNADESPR